MSTTTEANPRLLKLTEAGASVGPTAEHDPTLAALAEARIDMP